MKKYLKYKIILLRRLIIPLLIIITQFSLNAQTKRNITKSNIEKEEFYYVIDKAPEFPGGLDSLYSFIGRNLDYPETAIRDRIEGKIKVAFIIDTNGKVVSPEIIEGLRDDLNKSALEMLTNMPNWIPAEFKGEKIRVRQTLPLNFKL